MSHANPASAAPLFLLSALFILSSSIATAHNITRILDRYPVFSKFNDLLTKNDLAVGINRRDSITVLALTNDRIGDLEGKPEDVQKRILSTNIILDYYDEEKLKKLKPERTMLTALYQASGVADDKQGFIDVVHKRDDTIVFASAGGPLNVQLEGSVAKIPYNISVLSVSGPIIAPGIDGSYPVAAPRPPPKAATAPSPKAATAPPSVEEMPPPAESPEKVAADALSPSEDSADGPAVDAHAADSPVGDAPAADSPDPDDIVSQPPRRSGAGKQVISGVSIGFIVLTASFIAAH